MQMKINNMMMMHLLQCKALKQTRYKSKGPMTFMINQRTQWNYTRAQYNNMKQDNAELEIKTMRGEVEVIQIFWKRYVQGFYPTKAIQKEIKVKQGAMHKVSLQ